MGGAADQSFFLARFQIHVVLPKRRHFFNAPWGSDIKRRFCVKLFEPAVSPGASTPHRIQVTVLIGGDILLGEFNSSYFCRSRLARGRMPSFLSLANRRRRFLRGFLGCRCGSSEAGRHQTQPAIFLSSFSTAHFFQVSFLVSRLCPGKSDDEEEELGLGRSFLLFLHCFLFFFHFG